MLHSHAYAVAQQEGAIPRRILPGAPLSDAAPPIRQRSEEEPGDDGEAPSDTDNESKTENNHEGNDHGDGE
jgi:hypothetical protein